MATFVSVQVHKANEDTVERVQRLCEQIPGLNFNAVMNGIFTNLEEALKTYNPKTHRINLNLGNITIR